VISETVFNLYLDNMAINCWNTWHTRKQNYYNNNRPGNFQIFITNQLWFIWILQKSLNI